MFGYSLWSLLKCKHAHFKASQFKKIQPNKTDGLASGSPYYKEFFTPKAIRTVSMIINGLKVYHKCVSNDPLEKYFPY